MAGTITHQDKFHRVFSNVSSTGLLSDGCGPAFKVLEETTLRVSTQDFAVGNIVTVRGRLLDEGDNWTTIDTISGAESKVLAIHTWDEIQFEVTSYAGTPGTIVTSGFLESRSQEVTGSISGEFTPQGLNVALRITKVSTSDVAAKIPATPLSERNSMIILNLSTVDSVYVGNLDVTASGSTEGWEIEPGSFFSLDIKDTIEIYAIAPSGKTPEIKIMELA